MTQNTSKQRRSVPTYQRIEDDLRAQIRAGQWAEGVMLPSRRTLAAQYAVSVPTVERAIADLLADGTLRADNGRGTFVAPRTELSKSVRSPALLTSAPVPPPPLGAHTTVGIIAALRHHNDRPGSTSKWHETITNSIERTITQAGATTRFFNLNRPDASLATPTEAIEALLAEGVEAIVTVLCGDPHEIPQAVAAAARRHTPLVFVASGKSDYPALCVCYDSRDAGCQAAQHLLSRGCSDLLFFAPYTVGWVQARLLGVRQAALWAGLPAQAVRASITDESVEQVLLARVSHYDAGYAAARTLLQNGLPARGVVAANDYVALGFLRAAGEVGLSAGRDFALVGFDDIPESREAGLTSLHPPLEGLGQEAVRLALRAFQEEAAPVLVCLHSHLVSRSSSRFPLSLDRSGDFLNPAPTYLIPTHERVLHHDTAVL